VFPTHLEIGHKDFIKFLRARKEYKLSHSSTNSGVYAWCIHIMELLTVIILPFSYSHRYQYFSLSVLFNMYIYNTIICFIIFGDYFFDSYKYLMRYIFLYEKYHMDCREKWFMTIISLSHGKMIRWHDLKFV